jgi:hypothetical protein
MVSPKTSQHLINLCRCLVSKYVPDNSFSMCCAAHTTTKVEKYCHANGDKNDQYHFICSQTALVVINWTTSLITGKVIDNRTRAVCSCIHCD